MPRMLCTLFQSAVRLISLNSICLNLRNNVLFKDAVLLFGISRLLFLGSVKCPKSWGNNTMLENLYGRIHDAFICFCCTYSSVRVWNILWHFMSGEKLVPLMLECTREEPVCKTRWIYGWIKSLCLRNFILWDIQFQSSYYWLQLWIIIRCYT